MKQAGKAIRRSVLMRLAVQVFLFTLIYVGVLFALDVLANGYILQSIVDILGERTYFNMTLGLGRVGFILYAVIIYIIVVIVLCVRTITRVVRYVDTIGGSIDMLLDQSREVPDFPSDLRDIEVSLKDIRHEIYRSEQIAREAEQRKNDLVVYLAHDLKTPLTSVIGYLSLISEAPDLPIEQRAKYTSITLDKAYRLEQLINEFFDITRFNLQSITLERNRIDLSLMLKQLIDEFYPIFEEKNLKARVDIPSGIQFVGDAGKLERVFDNLLRNAVSYSYPETCIDIAARTAEGYAGIFFTNVGDEIPPERLERIFEKFFRTDAARGTRTGGAGLGLAIAKQIVELHGGSIQAASSRKFTRFTILLPMS
mgnify:CR=1 FL=1